MGVDFGALIVELESLVCSSKEDFVNEFWSSYEDYVEKYNKLLKDLQSLGFFKDQKPVEPVPFSAQSFEGGFSTTEKAKLREVTNASNVLLKKVRLLLSPSRDVRLNPEVRSNKVFVVGNSNEVTSEVTQTLQKLELEPIVLHEAPESRQTLIEKIGEHNHVSFAVVVLSPDELAYPKNETINEAKYLPKQDIVFELGYFLGRLGNENVVAVYRKGKNFEIPNQYSGILWVEHKTGWYFELIKQLTAAKFDVDANKLGWL